MAHPSSAVQAVASPAEVLFSREADTAFRVEYSHILLPLNITFLLTALQMLEEAHATWHNATQSNPINNSTQFANYTIWFLDTPKYYSPTEYRSYYDVHRLRGLKNKARRMADLFTTVDSRVNFYTRNYPDEAHDFLQNRKASSFPAVPKSNYYSGRKTRKRPARSPARSLLLPPAGQSPAINSRTKRGWPLIIAAGVIAILGILAVSFSALYTAKEIKSLHDSLRTDDWSHTYREENIGHSQSAIAHFLDKAVALYDHRWSDYRDGIATTIVLDAIERRLAVFDNAIACGLDRRVSPEHFLDVDLPRTAARIERHGLALGMVPLANHVSDWLQFEATLVATDYGLDVLMHVPLYDPSSLLHIYRFHPLPVPLEHGLHLSIDPAPYTHLAIDQTGEYYKALSLAELSACRKIGLFRLCDLGSVVRLSPARAANVPEGPPHADPELCLWALFSRDFATAGSACNSHLAFAHSAMAQVGPRSFASYSTTAHRGTITCHNSSNPHMAFTVNGLKKVTIPFGCWAETDTHRFTAADHSLTRQEDTFSVSYDWETPIGLLTRNLNLTAFVSLHNESSALVGQVDNAISLNHAAAMVETARLAAIKEDPTPLQTIEALPGEIVEDIAAVPGEVGDWTLKAIHSAFSPYVSLVICLALIVPAYVLIFRLRAELAATKMHAMAPLAPNYQPLIIHAAEPMSRSDRMTYRELLMADK